MLTEIAHEVLLATTNIPNPGAPTMPNGFDKFATILSWAKWLSFGTLVACLMYTGVRLATGGRGDDAAEHGGRIGKVLLGVIIVSGAFSLVAALAS